MLVVSDPILNDNPRDTLTLIQEQGWNAAALTPAQNRWLAAKLRTKRQLFKDGVKALTSVVATTIHLRVVSDEKAAANEAVCRANTCGFFSELTTGAPVCLGCNCSNRFLRSKWKDAAQACPKNTKAHTYWDNSTSDATVGTVEKIVGDVDAAGAITPS